jgi:HAD superfamily hydrolase (TIGR01549 family)
MAEVAQLALFDLDNTLVDRQATYRRWAEAFAARNGLDANAVEWLCEADEDGFARRLDLFAAARERFGLAEKPDELVAAYWAEYLGFYRPDADVTDSLKRLRSFGWRLAIVTNGPSTQHEKVARAGLTDLVDACCVSGEIGVDKPDRRIFAEALRRCGHSVDSGPRPWMVGDAPVPDICGGRDAGLGTIWVHRGRTWSIPDYRPDVEVRSVADAVEVLLAW